MNKKDEIELKVFGALGVALIVVAFGLVSIDKVTLTLERPVLQTDVLGVNGTINTLGAGQWQSTSSPYSALTTKTANQDLYIPGATATTTKLYSDTICLTSDSCITSWSAGASEWLDAGAYVYPDDGDYAGAPYFTGTSTTATSTFYMASTTDFSFTSGWGTSLSVTKLGNLTDNGVVTTGSGDGTLAVLGLVTESGAILSNDNDTSIPTSAAVRDYSDLAWGDSNRLGFVDNTEATISFDPSTWTFTLTDAGSGWSYYQNGVKYTISGNKTVQLSGATPADGGYYVYIDEGTSDGTLASSTSEWSLQDNKVPVALVYVDDSADPKYWLSDERHGFGLDRAMHYYIHAVEGAKAVTSPTLTGYTVDTDTDAAKTFAISASQLLDQDILHQLGAVADGDGVTEDYVVWYRTAADTWTWASSTVPYKYTAAGYIEYDSSGTMTEGQASKFYTSYLLMTNLSGGARYVVVPGRGEYASEAEAASEDIAAFTWEGVEISEGVIAYRFVWQTSNSYTSTGKTRLAAAPIAVNIGAVTNASSGAGTDHNTLSNLQGGTSDEYYHLTSADYTELSQWIDDVTLGSDGKLTVTNASSTWLSATTFFGAVVGNADTATALAANGSNCNAGEIPLGVDASGAVEGCYEPTEADITDLVHWATTSNDYYMYNTTFSSDITTTADIVFSGTSADIRSSTDMDIYPAGQTTRSFRISDDGTNIDLAAAGSTNIDFNDEVTFTVGTTTTPNLDVTTALDFMGDYITDITGTGLTVSGAALIVDVTANYAWTGAHDFGGASDLEIPNGTNPTVNAAGECAWNTTAASSSLRCYDGTAERALYPSMEKSFTFSSSTLEYIGSFGAAGTTTINVMNSNRPVTILNYYCKTDQGTAYMHFSDGTNDTDLIQCTSSGAEDISISSNASFVRREDLNIELGSTASSPGTISVTVEIRPDAD